MRERIHFPPPSGQVVLVWPGARQIPHLLGRLGTGGLVTPLFSKMMSSSSRVLVCCWGADGSGQTRSLVPCRQNSRISLYRYHCRSLERPDGKICGGNSAVVGTQNLSVMIWKLVLVESLNFFSLTSPGVRWWKVKWW